jgi:molybdopterin converting factor small subunit
LKKTTYDPNTWALVEHVAEIVNGRGIRNLTDKFDTQLKNGDEVAIFSPMAGG